MKQFRLKLKKNGQRIKNKPYIQKKVTDDEETLKRSYKSKQLNDFVSVNTLKFFERFKIDTGFLNADPATWSERDDYKDGLELCRSLQVVNDIAERAVQMFANYNRIGTKSENDLQYMMEVIQDYNNKYPSVNKAELN